MIESSGVVNANNALPIDAKLNEYKILDILGAGGFGITYKAQDIHLDKLVVIKEYMPNSFASRTDNTTVTCFPQDENTFKWGLKRFLEEAKLLAQFDHPAIVKTHRFFEANNTAYFVMDYYEGETLEDYLKKDLNRVYSQDEILSILMPIIEGLKAVHQKGFLHRDIAPDNIFLRKNRMPVLIDFGASRNAIGTKSQNISAIVKHGYSPPEQYTSNSKQNATTDIYALCAVMYEMITGKKPPESTYRQSELFNGNPDPIEDIVNKYKDSNKYSNNFLKTIQKGLEIKQSGRVQSIEELQKGLVKEDNDNKKEDSDDETIALSPEIKPETKKVQDNSNDGKTVVITPEQKRPKSEDISTGNVDIPKSENKNGLLYGIIALLVIALVGGAFYMYSNNPSPTPTPKPIPQPKPKPVPKPTPTPKPAPQPVVKTCSEGNAIACKEKADEYYSNNDTTNALEYYTKACNLGDNASCDKKSSIEDARKVKRKQKKEDLEEQCTEYERNLGLCKKNKIDKSVCTGYNKSLGLCSQNQNKGDRSKCSKHDKALGLCSD